MISRRRKAAGYADPAPPLSSPLEALVENDELFEIADATGARLCFVYFVGEPGRRSMMRRLSKDEARRLAN